MNILSKIIYIATFFLAFNLSAYSQSIVVAGPTTIDSTASMNDEYEIYFKSKITNPTLSDVNVKIKVVVVSIPEGHSFDCCWNGLCGPAGREDWDKSTPYILKSGETTDDNMFYAHYYCQYHGSDPVPGTGKLKYVFYNVNNPDDKAEINATFTFTPGGSVSEILANPNLKILHSESNLLSITSEISENFKLEIFAINGNKVFSQTFTTNFEKNLNEISTGVYLFAITNSNGQKVSSGKILIK